MWTTTGETVQTHGHAFYDRLEAILRAHRKRLLARGAGFSLGLLLRRRYGVGKPRQMPARLRGSIPGYWSADFGLSPMYGRLVAHFRDLWLSLVRKPLLHAPCAGLIPTA